MPCTWGPGEDCLCLYTTEPLKELGEVGGSALSPGPRVLHYHSKTLEGDRDHELKIKKAEPEEIRHKMQRRPNCTTNLWVPRISCLSLCEGQKDCFLNQRCPNINNFIHTRTHTCTHTIYPELNGSKKITIQKLTPNTLT